MMIIIHHCHKILSHAKLGALSRNLGVLQPRTANYRRRCTAEGGGEGKGCRNELAFALPYIDLLF